MIQGRACGDQCKGKLCKQLQLGDQGNGEELHPVPQMHQRGRQQQGNGKDELQIHPVPEMQRGRHQQTDKAAAAGQGSSRRLRSFRRGSAQKSTMTIPASLSQSLRSLIQI
jgi:hypothetical protein